MIKIFEKCPACGGSIVVTECKCSNCQLEMRGEFQLGQFASLSQDQLTFVQVFLRARGNLTEVEKVLGVSYPTIRNKLDEINATLEQVSSPPDTHTSQPEVTPKPAAESQRAILHQVAAGELSAADAARKLETLKGK